MHLYRGYRDYDRALAELEVARQTLPNDARIFQLMGYIQRRQGRWEEAIGNLERAADLDPRDIDTLRALAGNYSRLERLAELKTTLARILAVKPDDVFAKLGLA
jgi:tetratricopeptide (TPR) repeat protein